MTHTFEIREESRKFVIYNEQNVRIGYSCKTREEAEEQLSFYTKPVEMHSIPELDEALDKYEGKGLLNESYDQQKEVEDEIEVVSQGPEMTGNVIEFRGDNWTVVSSRYISAREAQEIEEMHDVFPTPGWHTVIRKVK